jgi:hypothetical protein
MRDTHSRTQRMSPRGGGPTTGRPGHGHGGRPGDGRPDARGADRSDGGAATDGVESWFAGRLPDDWFDGAPEISLDRDEILLIGPVTAPAVAEAANAATVAEAESGRATRFREETREARIRIAREAEHRYGRKVAWGVQVGGTRQVFTALSVPVMTRLRQPERQVLDTLVDAGVARSRSEALAWCVKLVGRNTESWLAELRTAMEAVQQVRERGPA